MDILFEDAHLLAASKPAGLLTQGVAGADPTFEDAVRAYLSPGNPSGVYLGTVHRLDRPVSGVVVWAKTAKAARRLADQFARRQVRKEYWAVVEGDVDPADGTWEDWLGPDDANPGRARRYPAEAPPARRAVTRFHAEGAIAAGLTWLKLWPETGRTHQLRVQTASRGHPIVGDAAYGAAGRFPSGIALHARRLTLIHPARGREIVFEAAVPMAWQEAGYVVGG